MTNMLNSAASRVLLSAAKSVAQKRSASAVSTPPMTHISNGEKMAHGILMSVSMLIIPGWVLANIKNYRAK